MFSDQNVKKKKKLFIITKKFGVSWLQVNSNIGW